MDTDLLQYIIEEFCRSAKTTQHLTGLLSNQNDDFLLIER